MQRGSLRLSTIKHNTIKSCPSDKRALKQYRAKYNRRYHARKVGVSESRGRPGRSMNPDAVRKREARLRGTVEVQREQILLMKKEIEELRRESLKQELWSAAEIEEDLEAALTEILRLREEIDARERKEAGPEIQTETIDYRLPNGAYQSKFTQLCAKVMDRGAAASWTPDVIEDVVEFCHGKLLAKKPSVRTLGRVKKGSGILSEAVVAQALSNHREKNSAQTVTMHYDQTTKFGVSLHGASLNIDGQMYSLGIKATPSKSAADQLDANRLMRANVAESGRIVLGLEMSGESDVIMATGAVVTDGGPTEAVIQRDLQEEKERKSTEAGMSKAQAKANATITHLPCHKHYLSRITNKTMNLVLKNLGVADPMALEWNVAKGYRATSDWGLSKGKEFERHCARRGVPNDLKNTKPPKHTRDHLRWASMASIYLAAGPLKEFIELLARKERRGQGEARGLAEVNSLTRYCCMHANAI